MVGSLPRSKELSSTMQLCSSTATGETAFSTPKKSLWLPLCVLLSLTLLGPEVGGSTLDCHQTCICASNIVSCSKKELESIPTALPRYTAVLDLSYNSLSKLRAEWTPVKLDKLHTLLLSHNGMSFISSEAFSFVPRLRYLDLSSNQLQGLEEYQFTELEELEVLLLYNNRISQIDRSAFEGVAKLQKLYLSQNQVSRFPLELVKEKTRLPELSLLDVSSNRVKSLPVQELKLLPAWIKNGLYFHNNPFTCDCELYSLLALWHIRRLNSAVDFRDEYNCTLQSPKISVRLFQLGEEYMNCSAVKEAEVEAYLGDSLTLECDTRKRVMTKTWVTASNEVAASVRSNQSAVVLANGSLQIRELRAEDSGVYTCYAVSDSLNETLYVSVRVHNFTMPGDSDSFNTAYTTLVGCVSSAILVLIYLYLTPCRCFCCPGEEKLKHEDSIHSSMLSASATPTHDLLEGQAGLNRHVAFIEPSKDSQGQNGKLNRGSEEEQEGKRGKGHRRKSDGESISSVFSDTPIVV
ncbi:Amphoterin-induced protein 1 [Acipenser ruthenus]|uniref:Amphoterin-induced protein 1 n=1 Tax=Acipenser ruthenus TaxID=7906 RepID=A0A662YL55_ACIRT|nr:Amphoterin-induced protein 1 [Acipenser ruthenus]RXM96885.1 Amphoterin-induced protein 1 [Acipenser ruthenus]